MEEEDVEENPSDCRRVKAVMRTNERGLIEEM
jgi:hypothetical protein